jgi:hypothetical protein
MRVVQQSVKKRGCQCGVAGEGLIPLPEDQVRGENNGAEVVAFGDDLKELMHASAGKPSSMSLARSKHGWGATHFMTKTLPRVSTEMSLHVLAYNLKRAMQIFGVGPLMQAIRA